MLPACLFVLLLPAPILAQDPPRPELRAGRLTEALSIDGVLDEPAWQTAEFVDDFTQVEPVEGGAPFAPTRVRVLAGPGEIVFGIELDDPDPEGIVSFSVRRDPVGQNEDHVRLVLGPFRDGRSGYVFAVNPRGARYDALIEPGGEGADPSWDGIWEAGARRTSTGWTAEIRIPIETISFAAGLTAWDFNIERRIQRALQIDRWASPRRQFQLTQTFRAGLVTDLPEFSYGLGLSVRPALTVGGDRAPAREDPTEGKFQPSLDVRQRIGPNVQASLTINTDFAETEVDTRRTNLTRFPLFFPEKRTFFLEGSDIFTFGLGIAQDVMPYFSRRIGLVAGREVPIIAGGKSDGRIGNTNFGALVVGTGDVTDVVPTDAVMGVARVRQNILAESWGGGILTVGDPLGRKDAWTAGLDFTYATSRLSGDKNFLVGAWALATGRDGLEGDRTAYGIKVDYPNDLWDVALTWKRIGESFDPSLGFVPRRSVHLFNGTVMNKIRPRSGIIQQLNHQLFPFFAMDLSGRWESYRIFFAPVNWTFRSGDRFELNANPTGERLVEPFEIAPDVVIQPGSYRWMRYRVEVGTAQKRRFWTQVTWWFGGFYDGKLDQLVWVGAFNPFPLLTLELNGDWNHGRLSSGDFTQTLVGARLRLNLSPDLSLSSYVQYETTTESVGTNTRLRWTFKPNGDLFIVYNHNLFRPLDRWQLDNNQLLIKAQYAFWF